MTPDSACPKRTEDSLICLLRVSSGQFTSDCLDGRFRPKAVVAVDIEYVSLARFSEEWEHGVFLV
jgi:hypothetical protein